ncbi:MAG: hypothetical protein ACXWYT_09445, partial [Actinomycetota bacterium]
GTAAMRRCMILVVTSFFMIACFHVDTAPARTRGAVQLRFFDRRGNEMSAEIARSRMSNGSAGWANDALIDPTFLYDVEAHPLSIDDTGHLSFTVPDRPVALAVNWPTTRGYSLLIVDNGGAGFTHGGVVNFTYRAALDAKRTLDQELAARPAFLRSAAFVEAYAAAASDLDSATASTGRSERGRYGSLALDHLAVANDLLLADYGTQFARATGSITPWLGVTMDTIDGHRARLDLASELTDPLGWVRIVMDPGTDFSAYAPVVRRAHLSGLKVMGQPIDSYYAKDFPGQDYLHRIQRAVTALPAVDAWEIGNEVNGGWLGPAMGDRIDRAAAWLGSSHPEKIVVLTFYWQIGTDAPQWSTFNWIRDELKASTIRNTDVFLLSTWVEDAPLGLAYDRILRALHDALHGSTLGIGELGYWGPGTSRAWWYGARRDPVVGRRIVLDQMYRASLGYSWSVGGVFWWYFAEDMPADPELAGELSKIRDDIANGQRSARLSRRASRPGRR